MRKSAIFMALAFVFCIFAGGASAANHTVRGRIIDLDAENNLFTINIRGKEHTVRVARNTIINRDGFRAKVTELQLADLIRATGCFDSEDRSKRVLDAHTVVAVSKGATKTTKVRGRVNRLDRSTEQFYLRITKRRSLRIQIVESTEVFVNGERSEFAVVDDGDSVSVLGDVQRANDGSFELVMTASRIDILRITTPDPPKLP